MTFLKTFWSIFAVVLLCVSAHAESDGRIFHYACKSGDDRYALTVNPDRGIVKLFEM